MVARSPRITPAGFVDPITVDRATKPWRLVGSTLIVDEFDEPTWLMLIRASVARFLDDPLRERWAPDENTSAVGEVLHEQVERRAFIALVEREFEVAARRRRER